MLAKDYKEVAKHINILNVVYHLNIEVISQIGNEFKAICPFCGYKDFERKANLNLNYITNKYHCFQCGKSGYSIGLFAKLRGIDNKQAFRELLEREFFSIDKNEKEIVPINNIADIEYRNEIYTDFLDMLKLELRHKKMLENIGFTNSSIEKCKFKSIPNKKLSRKIICSKLKYKYNLEGIPGFYMHEDFTWDFLAPNGMLIPVYDESNRIQGLSINLDKEFNDCKSIWFSSNNKINGTASRNWIVQSNITEFTKTVILTDNLLTYNLVKEVVDRPIIAFSGISNSYSMLKILEDSNIENIIFTIRATEEKQKLDYMIEKLFSDLMHKGYDITYKYIRSYKDILEDNFLDAVKIKVA